ncbi:efflux RND transporter periplasmic adaptor subunit [Sphingomonas immobilis]|uniref:Efflux RND transporter periplasmic adaptor subunit n=1 Tax=Sphingomonas immobilis TaxID=3063997 RepID=A0ABT9A1D8_9SPHN|nr:efflux RND transporter periplasmic adaptor subunit [Sphingomonas sp. CA1-15]MDO7843363.1 efflux RND transporter periplasmic adaptor subunit [Sphingomonas sp. CA1-15]
MTDQSSESGRSDLDDFLGTKPVPAWRRYVKWVAVAIGVILLLLLVRSCVFGGTKTEYATVAVERGALAVTVSATGKLAPTNQVDVGSELSGLVTKVVVDVNDRVTAGQPLALIDPSRFQDSVNQSAAALNAAKATVAQNQATLDQSNATLARYQEVSRLSGGRVPAKTEMDQAIADKNRAVANVRAAQANVVSAEATLSSNKTQLTKAVIRSPVNGVVLARQIEPGATVAASFNTPTLFVIAEDLTTMKLEVAIDEADVGQVKQGQKAAFTVDAFPGKTFPATITRVDLGSNLSAQSSSSTTTTTTSTTGQVVSYAATLAVSNADQQLRPGMTATADITTSAKQNVLLIPNAALRFKPAAAGGASSSSSGIAGALMPRPRRGGRGGGANGDAVKRGGSQTVYVKGDDGTPTAVQIITGETNGSQTEVIGGDLKPGMEVITGQLANGATGGSGGGQRRRSQQGGGGGQ